MPVKNAKTKGAQGKLVGEPLECPLCVEPLDETDLNFKPCPCGYTVCLFCFNQLKEKCNGLCPNCRREYGSAVPSDVMADVGAGTRDADLVPKQAFAATHTNATASVRAGAGFGVGGAEQQNTLPASGRAAAASSAAQATARQVPPAAASGAATFNRHEHAFTAGRGPGRPGDDAPALPLGANWAAPARHIEPQPVPPPSPPAPDIADASAWPDLQAAAQPQAGTTQLVRTSTKDRALHVADQPPIHPAVVQQNAQPQTKQQHHSRTSSCGGTAIQPLGAQPVPPAAPQRLQPTLPSMAQDPVVSPEQLGLAHGTQHFFGGGGYQNVQVSATAFGHCRTVGVTLTPPAGLKDALPEAPALRARLEQAISAGTMTAQEASAQLLALLGISHRDGEVPAPRPSRPPPPGFSTPVAQQYLSPADAGQALTAADSPLPALGRLQPIGTPIGPRISNPIQQHQPAPGPHAAVNGRYANGLHRTDSGTYNLWGGGLPGIHIANGYGAPAKVNLEVATLRPWLENGGTPGVPSPGLHNLGGTVVAPFNGFHPLANQQPVHAPVGNKPPPPGFSGVPPSFAPQMQQNIAHHEPGAADMGGWFPGLGGAGAAFSFNHQPPGPAHNVARGPPPGMPAAYRPQQLGAGTAWQ